MGHRQATKEHLRQLAKTLNVEGVQAILADTSSDAETVAQSCNSLRALALDRRTSRAAFSKCIDTIADRMVEFHCDSTVQKCALMTLAAFAEKKELCHEIGHSRCLETILRSWSNHFQDRNLVKDVLVTLRSLTMLEGNRVIACQLGAIELTIQAMKEFCSHGSIQSQSLSLLCNLTFGSDAAKLKAAIEGGAEVTVAAMNTFKLPKESNVQLKACIFLRSMSSGPKASENAVVSSGGLDCLIDALEYRRDEQVLEQAVLALGNLVRANPDAFEGNGRNHNPTIDVDRWRNRSILASSARILSATHSHNKRYARVHDGLLSLLSALVIDKEHLQAEIGKNGSLSNIICSVSHHIQNAELPVPIPSSLNVVRRAAALLRCLAFVRENRKILVEHEHGILVLVGCIRVLRSESLHAEHALLALANAIFDSPIGKEKAQSFQGAETVIEVMKEHLHESCIQEACLLAIRALCDTSHANSKAVTNLGARKLCSEAMIRFSANAVVQEHAMAVFIVLLQNGASFSNDETPLIMRGAELAAKTFPYSIALLAQKERLVKLLSGDFVSGKNQPTGSQTSGAGENTVPIGKGLGKQLTFRTLRSMLSQHKVENTKPLSNASPVEGGDSC